MIFFFFYAEMEVDRGPVCVTKEGLKNQFKNEEVTSMRLVSTMPSVHPLSELTTAVVHINKTNNNLDKNVNWAEEMHLKRK